MIKIAKKLNELLPHFSKVLEIGVNKNLELAVYAKQDLRKDQAIILHDHQYIMPSFEEYYRTYYFTELLDGEAHDSLTGRLWTEFFTW